MTRTIEWKSYFKDLIKKLPMKSHRIEMTSRRKVFLYYLNSIQHKTLSTEYNLLDRNPTNWKCFSRDKSFIHTNIKIKPRNPILISLCSSTCTWLSGSFKICFKLLTFKLELFHSSCVWFGAAKKSFFPKAWKLNFLCPHSMLISAS